MKKHYVVALFVGFVIIANLALAAPGTINYNKKKMQFGETIYLNMGDKFWPYDRPIFDANGYLYPEVFKNLVTGKFIRLEVNDQGEPIVVYIQIKLASGEDYVLEWHRIIRVIPQQRVIILNW